MVTTIDLPIQGPVRIVTEVVSASQDGGKVVLNLVMTIASGIFDETFDETFE